ncbi:hypothetical protein [Mycoplasma sp. P36-A1]|uniref:hypothetical protein n=1 Tax=Mycoplasma sp. P36-A1 TaxID=3252900 RepID=UPI003C2E51EB
MQETNGYYKQLKTNIIFDKSGVKIGTKNIKFNDIYFIREDYITNHASIFPTAFTVSMGMVGVLFSFLLFQRISLITIALLCLFGWACSFYITKIKVVKDNPNEYIKIIDILYTDTHESIIVPSNFKIDYQAINEKNKGIWQRRVLKNYISKINKSRKYLVQQHENNNKLDSNELLTKYSTVGKAKHGIKSFLSAKAIDALMNAYDHCCSYYVKVGFMAARFSVMMLIILIAYAFLNKDITFNSFI